MSKILCPFHDDTEPSCHLYSDGHFYCFVCSAHGKTERLGIKEVLPQFDKVSTRKPDSIAENIEYIESLPTKEIRGLKLPYNDDGYFIVWPDRSYYKLRLWEGKARYRAPYGVKKPLFKYPSHSGTLVIVEGELNAMTLAQIIDTDEAICSPGPCTDFMRYIQNYRLYSQVIIVADRDAAGAVYGKMLRDRLVHLKTRATLHVVSKDFNDVFTDEGEEAVIEAFQQSIRMAM